MLTALLGLCVATRAVASDGAGASSFRVRAGVQQTSLGREGRVLFELKLPFDALTRGAPRRARLSGLREGDGERGGEGKDGGVERAAELPRALRLSSADVERLVQYALGADRVASRARRLNRLASRAKSSAWLPELTLRGGRRTDQTLRLTPTASDPYRYSQSDGTDLYGEARAAWKLDRLLFAKEEVVLARQHQSERARRDQVVERLLTALFAWQRAELASRDPALDSAAQLRSRLDALQARLRLDVLTRGGFSRLVAAPSRSKRE